MAALRAAEKGYRVGVMEAGKRWNDEDLPKSQWHLPGFLWFPAADLYGIQRVEYLDDVPIWKNPLVPVNGEITPWELPGLGIELDDDAVAKLRTN